MPPSRCGPALPLRDRSLVPSRGGPVRPFRGGPLLLLPSSMRSLPLLPPAPSMDRYFLSSLRAQSATTRHSPAQEGVSQSASEVTDSQSTTQLVSESPSQ